MSRISVDEAAFRYATLRRRTLVRPLGSGQDGAVWLDSDLHAIKAFERRESFRSELECYHRLRERAISRINGFAIPTLLGLSRDLLVIEMDLVAPPYILDFGKAHVDEPPDYFDDPLKLRDWREEGRQRFGRHWPKVLGLVAALKQIGIYYYDTSPGNIGFPGELDEEDGDDWRHDDPTDY